MVSPHLWERSGYNPMAMLELMTLKEINELASNPEFLLRLDFVYREFEDYMDQPLDSGRPSVAYFCMEYGFHSSLKLYSGGLGVLAGDYLKQASDSGVRMVAVGLLFRYGYFSQSFTAGGEQISDYIPQKFSNLPMLPVRDVKGDWVKISVSFPGRLVVAKVWEVNVGRVKLFLLDTDIDDNNAQDRQITHKLYGGDWENRMKQELLLGVGGVKMLEYLELSFDVYHCNEGHAAFSVLERLKDYVQNHVMSFHQALETVRAQTLFTTHTPVPAGHDAFSEDMMRMYFAHFPEKLNLSWSEFIALGKIHPDRQDEKFSMSVLAMSCSQDVNGVSRIHGRVTREMFTDLYPGYFAEELYIDYVTNGVHLPTWSSQEIQNLSRKYEFDPNRCDQADPACWEVFNKMPDDEIWEVRRELKRKLLDFLKKKMAKDMTHRQESPRHIINVLEHFDENALYIGFARRFATYKRAHLLFKNLDKLRELVNNQTRPIRFVYAGKAHPADKAGQDYIKHIIEISRIPEFAGKIVFVENYDMEVARLLVAGVDVWLNTPTRPLEASGTSGIKACLNGVLNLSVLDGWWAEGYVPKGGWALKESRTYEDQALQDELDSETLYNLIEEEVLPLYFHRNQNDVPVDWVSYIKKNFTAIAPHFTMKRMLDEYYSKFYIPQAERSRDLRKDNYAAARALSSWKRRIMRNWDQISVAEINVHDSTVSPLLLGQDFYASVTLNMGELRAEDLALDIIFGQKEKDRVHKIIFKTEMKVKSVGNGQATYEVVIPNPRSGVFDYAIRMRPSNPALPNLQDFNLVKWL
ncbi:Glycogen phosphorylase [bioreactor metagenome]|uniref:Glycogen phosphorylase n=1 Tax=bioreactor metagenome TaxID=1076179 RepID=A0A644Z333_9ZZZZ